MWGCVFMTSDSIPCRACSRSRSSVTRRRTRIRPAHDLTYVAKLGLVDPPHMPLSLFADLAGAERAVASTLALLYARERTGCADRATVSLAEAAEGFARALSRHGGSPRRRVSGATPGRLPEPIARATVGSRSRPGNRTSGCAFAPSRGPGKPGEAALTELSLQRDAADWGAWASEPDLPLVAVA